MGNIIRFADYKEYFETEISQKNQQQQLDNIVQLIPKDEMNELEDKFYQKMFEDTKKDSRYWEYYCNLIWGYYHPKGYNIINRYHTFCSWTDNYADEIAYFLLCELQYYDKGIKTIRAKRAYAEFYEYFRDSFDIISKASHILIKNTRALIVALMSEQFYKDCYIYDLNKEIKGKKFNSQVLRRINNLLEEYIAQEDILEIFGTCTTNDVSVSKIYMPVESEEFKKGFKTIAKYLLIHSGTIFITYGMDEETEGIFTHGYEFKNGDFRQLKAEECKLREPIELIDSVNYRIHKDKF